MEFNKWNSSKNGHYSNFFFLGNIDQENVFYDILERKNAFLGYKNKKFKKTKNCIFPKGLTHGIGPKMAIISTFLLQAVEARKMSFAIFQTEKKPFQAIKTRISNRRKLDIFQKGLTYGFAPKMTVYPTFFFSQDRPGKCLLRYSRTKKRLSIPTTRSSKSEKIDVFPKGLTHAFGPKVAIIANFFFRQYSPGKCFFMIFQNKKTPFQAVKTRSSKSRKIDIFPWNCSKNGNFSHFFLGNIDQENVFYDILERKKHLLRL